MLVDVRSSRHTSSVRLPPSWSDSSLLTTFVHHMQSLLDSLTLWASSQSSVLHPPPPPVEFASQQSSKEWNGQEWLLTHSQIYNNWPCKDQLESNQVNPNRFFDLTRVFFFPSRLYKRLSPRACYTRDIIYAPFVFFWVCEIMDDVKRLYSEMSTRRQSLHAIKLSWLIRLSFM